MKASRRFAGLLLGAATMVACTEQSAPTTNSTSPDGPKFTADMVGAAPGYAVTEFATGFACAGEFGCPVNGLAFDASGNLYVSEGLTGFLYKFGSTGGVASPYTRVGALAIYGHGLTFSKDGNLFFARDLSITTGASNGEIVQLDPSNGSVIATITAGFFSDLAVDPLSGDLFAPGFDGSGIYRVSNPASGTVAVSKYASVNAAQLAFGPDGTLWTTVSNSGAGVTEVSATNTQRPGDVLPTRNVPNIIDGIAVSANPDRSLLFVHRPDPSNGNGPITVTMIDVGTDPLTTTDLIQGGAVGYGGSSIVIGPDGCVYSAAAGTAGGEVIKISNSDGTCLSPPLGPLLPDQVVPLINVPPGLHLNATSQFGAFGEYEANASDNFGFVTLVCDPPSGSTFPIGSVTVTCIATDPSGNQASASFQVIVLGADAQLETLKTDVASLGIPDGIVRSLTAKLDAALRATSVGDGVTARAVLRAFSNEVQAQAGKKIPVESVSTLLADAERIMAVLGG